MSKPEQTPQDVDSATTKIRFEEISKSFGRIVALEDVSLTIRDGEILALVGDNGAGKSTLMNILCGYYRPTEGTIYYDGESVTFDNPNDARKYGIETVYQDLQLMNDLDIATNIHLGQFPTVVGAGPLQVIDWERTYEQTESMLEFLDLDLDPHSEVAFLSGGERQLVAIARALTFDPGVIILDEPTSALSVAGTELIHDRIRDLRDEGHTQVVVSHSFDEVLDLADRIAVLYQGSLADVVRSENVDRETLKNLIMNGER